MICEKNMKHEIEFLYLIVDGDVEHNVHWKIQYILIQCLTEQESIVFTGKHKSYLIQLKHSFAFNDVTLSYDHLVSIPHIFKSLHIIHHKCSSQRYDFHYLITHNHTEKLKFTINTFFSIIFYYMS